MSPGEFIRTPNVNKRLRVGSGGSNAIKPKFSLDSVKDSAIGKRVVSPGSVPRLRKSKSKRTIRKQKSKLDTLDNAHLTSFQPPSFGSDTESICIIEDYIPDNRTPNKEEGQSSEPVQTASWPCVGCLKDLKVQRCFIKHNTSFACEGCIRSTPFITANSSSVVRIDPCGTDCDPYYVMEQGVQWYATVRKTFRWRWRLKGLI